MKNKSYLKNVMSIVLAALLVIAMQIVQSGSEIPGFKFWICFGVTVGTLFYIVFAAFELAKMLQTARKEISRLEQSISDVSKEELQPVQNK
jgi:preprotein translocase subunit SecF